MASQVIYPGDTSEPQVLPTYTPAQLCSRVIRKVFTIGPANIDANGNATIVMEPNMLSPAYIQRNGAVSLGPGILKSVSSRLNADKPSMSGAIKFMNSNDGTTLVLNLTSIPDTTPTSWSGFYCSCVAASVLDIYATTETQMSKTVRLRLVYKTAGAWTNLVTLGNQPVSIGLSVSATGVAVPAGTTAIGFQFIDESNQVVTAQGYGVKVSMVLGNGVSAVTVSTQALAANLFQEIPDYILDANITDARVTSMSILATNTSPPLYKGGNIYAARAPRECLTDIHDLAKYIQALPSNRGYRGAAESGAYAWWYADTQSISEPAPIWDWTREADKQDVLVIRMEGLDPEHAAFQCHFAWSVEFHTPNQLFEKVCSPPYTPAWENARFVLSTLNAATCNPDHLDILRSIVAAGKRAYTHYEEHRGLYDALASILTKALVAI